MSQGTKFRKIFPIFREDDGGKFVIVDVEEEEEEEEDEAEETDSVLVLGEIKVEAVVSCFFGFKASLSIFFLTSIIRLSINRGDGEEP